MCLPRLQQGVPLDGRVDGLERDRARREGPLVEAEGCLDALQLHSPLAGLRCVTERQPANIVLLPDGRGGKDVGEEVWRAPGTPDPQAEADSDLDANNGPGAAAQGLQLAS